VRSLEESLMRIEWLAQVGMERFFLSPLEQVRARLIMLSAMREARQQVVPVLVKAAFTMRHGPPPSP
jgi:hypothetical protein